MSTVAWFAVLSSLVSGWLAVIYAIGADDGGMAFLAAAFAFGLPALALFLAAKR